MNKLDEATKKLGETFIIGFEGTKLSDDTAAFLSQAAIGGVLLFTKNYSNPHQLIELTDQIQSCRAEFPLWISVDQEGGRVQRLKDPFTILPTAQQVGALNSPKLCFELAEAMARELKAVGINLNFCPVADINTNPSNPIIGGFDRAFGSTEDAVSKIISGIVRGHVVQGIQPCVKHFPGHGDTDKDSHLDLPKVTTPLETLRNREFRPFVRAFKSRCNMVMTAHILNASIDPELPATLSKRVLQDLLRKELRYSGIIISDDLEMQAITDHFGAAEAPVRALDAGCDLLIYRTEGAARKAYESVIKALESGAINPERVIDAADRSRALKKETLVPYKKPDPTEADQVIGCAAHQELAAKFKNA